MFVFKFQESQYCVNSFFNLAIKGNHFIGLKIKFYTCYEGCHLASFTVNCDILYYAVEKWTRTEAKLSLWRSLTVMVLLLFHGIKSFTEEPPNVGKITFSLHETSSIRKTKVIHWLWQWMLSHSQSRKYYTTDVLQYCKHFIY